MIFYLFFVYFNVFMNICFRYIRGVCFILNKKEKLVLYMYMIVFLIKNIYILFILYIFEIIIIRL